MLAAMSAATAVVAINPQAFADDDSGVTAQARALYKRALVFDANLYPPLDGEPPYPRERLDLMHNSGVTAMKSSLGGLITASKIRSRRSRATNMCLNSIRTISFRSAVTRTSRAQSKKTKPPSSSRLKL
jgi:hypothetical protein